MSLQEVMKAVDQLSPDELRQLRDYINQREVRATILKAGTMNVDTLLDAAQAMRTEMDGAAFDEMLNAMNEEYIEPVDEDEWNL